MLELKDFRVSVGGAEIIKGVNLIAPSGEVHAIMGPNGSGKSTLSYALAGREGYEASGVAKLDGQDLLALAPEERAHKGLFLSFQYPVELAGVPALTFLKAAFNAQRKGRGEKEMAAPEFLKLVRSKAEALKMPQEMLKRGLNAGFSGGEKKRMEALQLSLFQPKLAILDETDSGLDIDALKIVADAVNATRAPDRTMLVITHYQRLLDFIKPDRVHVLARGRIAASGGPELALELERSGYDRYLEAA
ncbi:MAG: Fe-S cluster assembly ATPase SufC [Hyphomonadaceae bacterium]|nr:Fe-S cluster assembly ATPase SufC [Hyphomonadaceae bacterium]